MDVEPHRARRRLRDAVRPLLLTGLALAALGSPTLAQQLVRVGARVVLAGDEPSLAGMPAGPRPDDRRLQAILPRLEQLFRYRQYTWLERYRAEVPVGTSQRWPVPGGRQLEITPDGVADRTVRIRVKLAQGATSQLATTVQVASGQPVMIGGPPYANGVLILIIWANPNDELDVRDELHRGPSRGLK